MKKIFTASLVAMMAVTAANADIASTGYVDQRTGDTSKLETTATELTGAVNELKTQLGTVSSTAGDAATKSELQTAQQNLQTAIDTEKGRIDSINTNMSGVQSSISDLTSDVGGLADGLEAEVTARTEADTAINNKIGTVAEGKTVVGLIDEAKQAASGANTELAGRVTANENSIKEINDSDVMQSGVKAATVAQVETNKTDIANIKTEQTTQNNNISALQTSLAEGGATAKAIEDAQAAADKAQGEVDALEGVVAQNKTDAATAASNAETAAKTYADEKVADLDSSIAVEAGKVVTGVTVVDGKITASEKMALTALANFPVACQNSDTHCALTIDGGNLKWEVVK